MLAALLAETLSVDAPVLKSGEVVGYVTLQSEITGIRQRYLNAFLTSSLFGISLVLLTSLVTRFQVMRIVSPLKKLAAEFADIGRLTDLTRRLPKERDDEVGILIDAFNEMFVQIDSRDQQLQHHRNTLEDTVSTRTAELVVAKNEAEQANAAKSDFLATMSHEIRTPMNGMMVMAEMLSMAPLSPTHLRYAEIINRSGKNLLHIINDILDFSKIEAGKLDLELIEFDLDVIVEDVISLFSERAREKNLSLAICVAPGVPCRVVGDPTRLSQIVGNLVNNALKFTEVGGVMVDVECWGDEPEQIRITVTDTGIGIASEKLQGLFGKFTQADQSITRKFGGTGLGLSIAKRLVEAMDGTLNVVSELGRGSAFSVELTLPVVVANDTPFQPACAKHVLILFDDPIASGALHKALRQRGFETTAEWTGDAPHAVLLAVGVDVPPALPATDIPIVLLRPFAGTTSSDAMRLSISGELQLPLRRRQTEELCQCLASGDFTQLAADARGVREVLDLPDLSHLKVLAVDDTAVNREVLREALRGFGITADLAGSGEEALEVFQNVSYDVIFMDCSMPGMDGFTATRRLRELEERAQAHVIIVALTAHVTGAEAERWRDAGMDAYLAKPFTLSQLRDTLISVTAEKRRSGKSADPLVIEAPPSTSWKDSPVLSEDTMSMFRQLAGGSQMIERVFSLFKEHAPRTLADLEGRLAGPPSEARKVAHALKSMCMSAGAERAAAICSDIENQLRENHPLPLKAIESLRLAVSQTVEEMTRRAAA